MNLNTLRKLIFEKNIFGFLGLSKNITALYSTSFATSASACGLLNYLTEGAKDISQIHALLGLAENQKTALEDWLTCGVKFRELAVKDGQYAIKGRLSKKLAKPKNKIANAMFEEVVRYHYDAVLNAPQRLRAEQKYKLSDQDGDLIARSSQILEPFVEEAIDWCLKNTGQTKHVLEVGCGSGKYIVYLKERIPEVRIHAIDFQEEVINGARETIMNRGISEAVELTHIDVFQLSDNERYDLITLHNNIYYFSEQDRLKLLEKLHHMLNPGGTLLLTTSCRGGSPAVTALNLWFSLSEIDGGLPQIEELLETVEKSGFNTLEFKKLMPGESYYAILAKKGA